jgi:hypothetical protein
VPGPSIPPEPARGGRVEVRTLADGEEIVLRPTGPARFFVAAFLAFWLCGWAIGEAVVLVLLLGPLAEPLVDAARELLPGVVGRVRFAPAHVPPPVAAFLAVWLAFWTWGGLSAARELLRLLAGSDRYLLRPGGFTLRRAAGPFGRTRLFRSGTVAAVEYRRRRSVLFALVGGKEVPLSAGVPPEVGLWLAERLREALGLPRAAALREAEARRAAAPAGPPPVPEGWQATPRPEGGVVLSAPSGRSRKTAGCALLAALLVTAGAGALVVAAAAKQGTVSGLTGLATAAVAVALAVDALCFWAAFARDAWTFAEGRVERIRTFGPWSARREVRGGRLVVAFSADDDGDDWFTLEARGEGGSFRLVKSMNSGPEVLAFARFAAWHTGLPLDVPDDAREAAGETAGG